MIDNPTKQTLNIMIDNNEYIVSAGQNITIELGVGNHKIEAKNDLDSIILPTTNFEVKSSRGLINPTKSVYFIYGMPYGPNVNKDSIFSTLKTSYQGKTYAGDVVVDSAIYTENFYYNLNEDFPKLTLKSENSVLRKKIFREEDFKQFYFMNYE